MTSILAKGGSCSNNQVFPLMSNQENGTRNKRKFQPDTSSGDLNKVVSVSDWPSYEFSANKIEKTQNHGQGNVCAGCGIMHDHSDAKLNLALSTAVGSFQVGPSRPREEIDAYDEFRDITDWSDLTESQLEELVLMNLDTMFKSAIKKIMAFGYNKEVSTKAVLRSGILYGCKDPVSNIVDNAITFIRNGQVIDPTIEHYFDCLQQMEKYTLVELVCILRDIKHLNSTGNALWCLLICDMNVTQACAMDVDASNSLVTHVEPNQSDSSPPIQAQLGSELAVGSECCLSKKSSNKNPSLVANGTCQCEPNITCSTPIADNYQPDFVTPKSSFVLNGRNDNKTPAFDDIDKSFVSGNTAYCHAPGQKSATSSRKTSGISKRDHILRQKSLHMEKNGRPYSSKGSSGSRKVYGFGGSILDKKVKPVLDSMSHNLKHASLNASKNAPQDNKPHNLSATFNNPEAVKVVSTSYSSTNIPLIAPLTSSSVSSLPLANTELSLSFPSGNYSHGNGNSGMPNDQSINNWIAQSKKDDMILKLVPKVRELQNQLQEWTEWANQKVMQVTRRLSKDKAEIKTLRQDREEVERIKKETQTLEENTMKKLPEMEKALGKAGGQVEKANASVRRLEMENAVLRQNLEAAKLQVAESTTTYMEVLKREKKSLQKFQTRGKENTLFHEELTSDKHMLAQLQQKIEQAKDVKEKLEERWKREEKAKEELQCHVNSIRKEREEAGRSYRLKEDDIKVKIACSMQKYKEDVAGLEKGISELRLKSDSSKIEALRRGIDGSKSVVSKEELEMVDLLSGIGRMHLQELDDREEDEYCVKRERECVMCLFQEMVVVFLPCAHQVVCAACNELHKKQGMTECPSCRAFIEQRIYVRFAHT
ncbi:putative E3 ubiquitin-protein ligase RF298 [Impatiens glandulifera]|uniref:putative E3 ubiquitin-protein ligase RF298 n=1 Tax=Impatiens glandulifera TaxID=253017 RepID=UPI001FB095DB|nr:putative E3 ubiquitin-protein ligase RF298 [Impatiens glandulifera]